MPTKPRLRGELTLDDSQFHAALRKSYTAAEKFSQKLGAVAGGAAVGGLVAVTAAVSAAGAAFVVAIKRAGELGGSFTDLSAQVGAPIAKLALLSTAFDDASIGGEALGAAFNKMQSSIEAGGDIFRTIRINLATLKQLSPEDQFLAIGKAIGRLGTAAEQTDAARKIFGRGGGRLLSFFKDTGGLEQARKTLGSMPEILEKNAAIFDTMGDKIHDITKKWDAFAIGLSASVAPALNEILEKIISIDTAAIGLSLGKDLAAGLEGEDIAGAIAKIGGGFVQVMTAAVFAVAQVLTGALLEAFARPVAMLQARVEQITETMMRALGANAPVNIKDVDAQISRQKDFIGKNAALAKPSERFDALAKQRIKDLEQQKADAIFSGNLAETFDEKVARIMGEGVKLGWGQGKTGKEIIQDGMDKVAKAAQTAFPQTAKTVASTVAAAMSGRAPAIANDLKSKGRFPTIENDTADSIPVPRSAHEALQQGTSAFEALQAGTSAFERLNAMSAAGTGFAPGKGLLPTGERNTFQHPLNAVMPRLAVPSGLDTRGGAMDEKIGLGSVFSGPSAKSAGGVRRMGESREDFRARMDAAKHGLRLETKGKDNLETLVKRIADSLV